MGVQFEDDGGPIPVFYGEADMIAVLGVGYVDGGGIGGGGRVGVVARDLAAAAAGSELDFGAVAEVLQCDLVRREVERADVPACHVGRELDLDVSKEERDADSSEPDPAAEWVPSCDLRAGLEDVGQFQGHDAQDRVVFAVSLCSDGDADEGGAPVTHESFRRGVEDGLRRYCFGSSAVDLVGMISGVLSYGAKHSPLGR